MTIQSMTNVKQTPIYISPKSRKSNEYIVKTDVYAYAFIVYEVMTNQVPYEEVNQFASTIKVIN